MNTRICRVDILLSCFFFVMGLLHGNTILSISTHFSRNHVEYLRKSTLYGSQDLLHPNKLGSGFEHIVLALGMVSTLFLCKLFQFKKICVLWVFWIRIHKDLNGDPHWQNGSGSRCRSHEIGKIKSFLMLILILIILYLCKYFFQI